MNRPIVDHEVVLADYAITGSNRETARRLGIHENTVLKARRVAGGGCHRCANGRATEGTNQCEKCLQWGAEHARNRRAKHSAAGICITCKKPAAEGVKYCQTHREILNARSAADRAKAPPKPRSVKRLERIKGHYGQAGLDVFLASGDRCEICGAKRAPTGNGRIHIHHIDKNRENNVHSNLVVLCIECHRGVHAITEIPDFGRVLAWIRERYPAGTLKEGDGHED